MAQLYTQICYVLCFFVKSFDQQASCSQKEDDQVVTSMFVSSQWFNQRSESSRSLKTAAAAEESNFGLFFSLFVVIIIDLQQTMQDGLTVEMHESNNCILQRYAPASPQEQLAVAVTYRTFECTRTE